MAAVLRGAPIRLGAFPTPVEAFEPSLASEPRATDRARLWVKRDDRSSAVYGGNKVRKLELLLGDARARGKTRLVTVGAAGSHQVLATALFGAREGFEVEAVLVPQPASAHARANLAAALSYGLLAVASPTWSLAPPLVLSTLVRSRLGRDAYLVPLGGSNALGALGFVDAARELAAQVAAGALPEPDEIVVAMGSGGTAAGLAVGLEQQGLRTRVVGVAISEPVLGLRLLARRLVRTTAEAAGLGRIATARAERRLSIDAAYLGKGYGHPSEAGASATARAAEAGILLDPTYTAKSFACALARVAAGRAKNVLYWHTLSSVAPPLAAGAPPGVPAPLDRLFRPS